MRTAYSRGKEPNDRRLRPGRALLLTAAALALLAMMGPGEARTADSALNIESDPSSLCETAAIHYERENALPRALLAAVAMAESGRYSPKTGKSRAWPWTINAEGKAYYFNSKREAVAKTQQLLDSGMRSIDVGCMQVNLRYHPHAFASLDEAFDPMVNMAYGAEFLMDLRERTGSWQQAVANYHSQTAWRGGRYFARVIRIWKTERERVADIAYMPPRAAEHVDLSGLLKPAIHRSEAQALQTTVTSAEYRPAPKVLHAAPVGSIRASAAVGLRLSIAEGDMGEAAETVAREEPKVLDPLPARSGPTQMAEAAIPGA
ncbi:MAG: hypothetical protein C0454_06555 [Parvibaculum sp.]|nr:hypothetical protein [Parvibaculum sp.]